MKRNDDNNTLRTYVAVDPSKTYDQKRKIVFQRSLLFVEMTLEEPIDDPSAIQQ